MTLTRSVAEILRHHVTLDVEGIDRMYLNAVVPILQTERGISWFFREVRGHSFASSALMAPMTRDFVDALEAFARSQKLDVVTFEKKSARRTWLRSTGHASAARRACSSSAKPRRRLRCSERSGARTRPRARLTLGGTVRRPW